MASSVSTMLPGPFDWCEIPAGSVQLIPRAREDTDDYEAAEPPKCVQASLPAFAIARYPVTNAAYARFIEAGGYQNPDWWTKTGWSLCQKGNRSTIQPPVTTGRPWTEPLFWQDAQWNGADYPVVGISWYEAFAFCRWLSAVSGEHVALPTEFQWQRAAQDNEVYPYHGPRSAYNKTGRRFPWGDTWDASRCNNHVDQQGIGRTTPVQQYEGSGDSYFGVVDMAGNVWEWCLTKSSGSCLRKDTEAGDADRYCRGGSWADGSEAYTDEWDWSNRSFTLPFQTDYRSGWVAWYAGNNIGFRIVRNDQP